MTIPTDAKAVAFENLITDVFNYLRHVGGLARAVQQKTANGLPVLVPSEDNQ